MIGARHSAGSTISNGGGNSPSKRVIPGRRPLDLLLEVLLVLLRCGPFCRSSCPCALSVIATRLPSEKVPSISGTPLGRSSLFQPSFNLWRPQKCALH